MRLRRNLGLVLLLVVPCFSQSAAKVAARSNGHRFRVESTEVTIPFSAMDGEDHLVPDLENSDLRLFDNGLERALTSLFLEDGPASIVFVLDVSGSMKKAAAYVDDAVQHILRNSADGDEFAVIEFSNGPQLTVEFTSAEQKIRERLQMLTPAGRTSLIDAAVRALKEVKHGHNSRKAIVVISDGQDNHSRNARLDAIRQAMETDVRIYGIELYPTFNDGFSKTLLQSLAECTGGRYLPTVKPKNIPELIAKIDIHRFYRASFSLPPEHIDGEYHRIELKLNRKDRLRGGKLFWKRGYRLFQE